MPCRTIFLAALLLASCGGAKEQTRGEYMDLNGFFSSEAKRLQQEQVKVDKTVSRNGVFETRKGIIPDWTREVQLFTESDINKPAWSKSYKITASDSSILYSALDSGLRTRSLSITKDKLGRIREISISNRVSNELYHTSEELKYIPDSMYRIYKEQDVIFLGRNEYEIKGLLQREQD